MSIIAHSHGTLLSLLAAELASNEAKYVSQMVLMEPCLVPNANILADGLNAEFYDDAEQGLDAQGVKSLFGPNWSNDVFFACLFFGYDYRCDALRSIEVAGSDLTRSSNPFSNGEVGVRHFSHMAQNGIQYEFQEFRYPNWYSNQDTPDFGLTNVDANISVKAMWSSDDTLCIPAD